MYCRHCQTRLATQKHHVIAKARTKTGSDNPENLIDLCEYCHYQIHFGLDSNLKMEILTTCFDYIRHNTEKCIHKNAKIIDWKIPHIKAGNYNFIFERMGLK